ncbi:MAG: hypothetical protein FWD05_10480 [Oscillospiraceae bacterium]|nr:hypothetical protein [Oscillospiraceae bacterium]
MLKYIIAIFIIITIVLGSLYAYFSRSVFIDLRPNAPITAEFRTEGESIMQQNEDGTFSPIQLRGVEMTPSIPGYMAWDFGAYVYDYLRWFEHIEAMGANTVYVPSTMDSNFYYAFYRHNRSYAEEPLLLLQGIAGNDYDSLTTNLKEAIDIIHGRRINFFSRTGVEMFLLDVSEWVVGFVAGTEWDPDAIVFMNHFDRTAPASFEGEFFSSAEGASPFEVMLTRVMDTATSYESRRFKTQRPIGFISSPITDFLEYAPAYSRQLRKYAQLDAENILPTESMPAGTFAAYRLFEFADDFSRYISHEQYTELAPIFARLDWNCIYNGYLDLLVQYHTMPVIATGFGFSTARSPYRDDRYPLTEREQGEALANMVTQLEERNWGGSIISTWQDNWERRTWNTAFSSNPWRYQYWHNVQAVDQSYGLMAFDPGRYENPVVIDGNVDDWDESYFVHEYDGIRIYAQYTYQGLYLLIRGEGVNPHNTLYLPIDVTPHTGTSMYNDLNFERPSDFLLILSGTHNSRLLVNQRYHATHQRFSEEMTGINPYTHSIPPMWNSEFVPILLGIQNTTILDAEIFESAAMLTDEVQELVRMRSWDTGILTHGIGNPASPNFNSLADFYFGDNLVEIRLPWMMLNFYDPSYMQVHDDYYVRFGVEGIRIQNIYIGIATEGEEAPMSPIPLNGWRRYDIQTHERLKQSYFIMQELWN